MEITRIARISSQQQVISWCCCASSHELWVCAINFMTKLLDCNTCASSNYANGLNEPH